MTIRLLDPTIQSPTPTTPLRLAQRLTSFDGATIGLLANGKTNGMELLDRVVENLQQRHRLTRVIRVTKKHFGLPMEAQDLQMMAEQCMAVMSAIGD